MCIISLELLRILEVLRVISNRHYIRGKYLSKKIKKNQKSFKSECFLEYYVIHLLYKSGTHIPNVNPIV